MSSDSINAGAVVDAGNPSVHCTPTEVWGEPPCEEIDGRQLRHALEGSSLLQGLESSEGGPWQARLRPLLDVLGGERIFLFSLGGGEPLLGGGVAATEEYEYVASSNFDGEEIAQATEAVQRDALRRAARERLPASASSPTETQGSEGEQDPPQELALPVCWSVDVIGAVYVENRFRPLMVDRTSVRLAEFYCRQLATALRLDRLTRENASLWIDVSRLREEQAQAARSKPRMRDLQVGTPKAVNRSELKGDYSMIVGSSSRMTEIFQILDRISTSNAPVLINGESGTGKELIAQAVHQNSLRTGKPFVSENCGALTETLLESELFGYVRGAFTGATKDHKGLFEHAEGGTLFLDEVGDMSAGMQKKLLRVLQEGVIRRVGGKEYIQVDVRILSATNKDLLEEVKRGNFREDLYYRLNVINLKLPPLRDRKEDIPAIVEHFLRTLSKEAGLEKSIHAAAMDVILAYDWPGNIRELQNEVRRMFALADTVAQAHDLSDALRESNSGGGAFQTLERELAQLTLREATERLETEMIKSALAQCRGNKSLVAKMLQVPKTSLYNKINKYGIGNRP